MTVSSAAGFRNSARLTPPANIDVILQACETTTERPKHFLSEHGLAERLRHQITAEGISLWPRWRGFL